jgi:hypothetical protein
MVPIGAVQSRSWTGSERPNQDRTEGTAPIPERPGHAPAGEQPITGLAGAPAAGEHRSRAPSRGRTTTRSSSRGRMTLASICGAGVHVSTSPLSTVVPSRRELRTGGDARTRGNEHPTGSHASCRPLLRSVRCDSGAAARGKHRAIAARVGSSAVSYAVGLMPTVAWGEVDPLWCSQPGARRLGVLHPGPAWRVA